MSCDVSLLDQLVHGELDSLSAARVNAHLAGCASCRGELSLLREEREAFTLRARRHVAPPAIRRAVMNRCEKLAARERLRSRIAGGLGFALSLAFIALLPMRQTPQQLSAMSEVNASFCDTEETATSFSRALHCGGGELVAQAETEFHACLVASPLVGGFGPDACE